MKSPTRRCGGSGARGARPRPLSANVRRRGGRLSDDALLRSTCPRVGSVPGCGRKVTDYFSLFHCRRESGISEHRVLLRRGQRGRRANHPAQHSRGIIAVPTLDAFRAAGFLFDHGIRCRLADREVATQRRLARTYSSPRANAATHLASFIRNASAVWVMGYVARNAVAAECSDFPRDTRDIARCPYPLPISEAPKFFVSRYLTRAPRDDVAAIFREFAAFWVRRSGDSGDPSNSAVQRPVDSRCPPSGR